MTESPSAAAGTGAAAPPARALPAGAATALRRLGTAALLSGLLAVGLCVLWAAWTGSPSRFFRSYLVGFLFCADIALGCLGLLMLSHLTGGDWGLVPRRILEAAGRSVPLLFALFLPILGGLPWLYAFARPAQPGADEALQRQGAYLNPPFYIGRSLVYFALWTLLAWLLTRGSRHEERSEDRRVRIWAARARALSGPGLFFSCLAVSFAATDWVMILLPQWSSTIFGLLILAGQGLSAYAFVIVVLAGLSGRPPFAAAVSTKLWHDLGKLLQALVLLWAYMEFSQLLIIWTGNLPREIPWYMSRLRTSWVYLGLLLLGGHFVLPFFLLLFRGLKRRAGTLAAIAGLVLLMRLGDALWLTLPSFHPQGLRIHALDVVLPIGLFCVWFSGFAQLLRRRLGPPLADPGIADALARQPPGGCPL